MAKVIRARFNWSIQDKLDLMRANLATGGKVQAAIDNACIAWCQKYTPFKTGTLSRSPYTATPPGSGQIIYNTPYARYLYYGVVYGPNIPVFEDDTGVPTRYFSPPGKKKSPKVPEKKLKFDTSTNPMAGPFWFERMKADHSNDILKEAKQVAGI